MGRIGENIYNKKQFILLTRKGGPLLKKGADIIPQYTFGTNTAFYRPFGPSSILAMISSRIRVSILIWFGRWFDSHWFHCPLRADIKCDWTCHGNSQSPARFKGVGKPSRAKVSHELLMLCDEYKVVMSGWLVHLKNIWITKYGLKTCRSVDLCEFIMECSTLFLRAGWSRAWNWICWNCMDKLCASRDKSKLFGLRYIP